MHAVKHIQAYWLNRAMSIPGGASNMNIELRIQYWSYIAQYNSFSILCGDRY